MADFDHERINALLYALREWDPTGPPMDVEELARRHRLDPLIVRRLAESEGVPLEDEEATPVEVDEDAITGPIDVDERS